MSLEGYVCLVTGASRGIGKGIAQALGSHGATVYITGRSLKPKDGDLVGSLVETARLVNLKGGTCIPVQCDHSKDEDIKSLFDQIETEQNGRLDLLVNNAFSAIQKLTESLGKNFWEMEPELWDEMNAVGLRNYYICSVYAARLMVARQSGLIVNTSAIASLFYAHNVAFSVGKTAVDKLSSDCSTELKTSNVAVISLWPASVATEFTTDFFQRKGVSMKYSATPEFIGKGIVHLLLDDAKMKKTGQTWLSADLALHYGFTDIGGTVPGSWRQVNTLLDYGGHQTLSSVIPDFIRFPKWMLHVLGYFAIGQPKPKLKRLS